MAKIYVHSPIGWLQIKGSVHGISSIKKVDKVGTNSTPLPPILQSCADQLSEYFAGTRKNFDLKLDWSGHGEFYQSVWKELLNIPYGQTCSYASIAERLHKPKAVRAVGLANRNNPIAIVVPCHRVIAKDGKLQGYFYGLEIKRQLLQIENPQKFATQGSLF